MQLFNNKTWPAQLMIALCVGLSFTACEEYLEEVPASFASPENSYETAANAEAALTGAYGTLQQNGIDGTTTQFHLTDVQKPSFFNTQGGMGSLSMNGNNTQFVLTQWEDSYRGINAINSVIDNVPGIDMDLERRSQIVAEARFLRAFYYFRLVRLFGEVPLRLTTTASLEEKDLQVAESTVDEVYAAIINDLEIAVNELPETTQFPSRASQGAAKTMLAKVYLTRGSMAKRDNTGGASELFTLARNLAGEVMASGQYDLVPYYPDVFTPLNKNNSEIIFDIAAQSGGIGEGTTLGIHMGLQGPHPRGGSFGTIRATEYYHTMFDEEDIVRREWSAPHDRVLGNGNLRTNFPEMAGQPWKIGKFRRWPVRSETFISDDWDGHFPVFRYAEVILMFAEATNELSGPTVEVFDAINMIRARARVRNTGETWEDILPRDLSVADTVLLDLTLAELPDQDAMLAFIQDERAREFGGEFKRWYDLVRWGIYVERIKFLETHVPEQRTRAEDNWAIVAANVGERHLLMPKPNVEIRTNPNVTQNDGY